MPEAEDVIIDVARHATGYAAELWRRHRNNAGGDPQQRQVALSDVCRRLELLIAAVFQNGYPIRNASPPAPPTLLARVFNGAAIPRSRFALPATDGASIWLPPALTQEQPLAALDRYRLLALQQAARAARGSSRFLAGLDGELQRSLYLVLEAQAADAALLQLLPGIRASLQQLRACALRARPPLAQFPESKRALEEFVRSLLGAEPGGAAVDCPSASLLSARSLAHRFERDASADRREQWLFRDCWTGELRLPPTPGAMTPGSAEADETRPAAAMRSARLSRRPAIREAEDGEDDRNPGAWMVQTAQPHEKAEDPAGLQRPADRDESAAEEFADALSELDQARLVATPGRPKEILLADDLPPKPTRQFAAAGAAGAERLFYPEWDYRSGTYRQPGAMVRLLAPREGSQEWISRTLARHRSLLQRVRRRFEMLRALPVRRRKQFDGDEIDLEACIESDADFKAGLPMAQALYQTSRHARRDLALVLLIDISGSTDSWISSGRRVIDIEREALLLVSIALQGLAAPYALLAFSGEGPHAVTLRLLKSFDESCSEQVARRIAALEPEHYTRAGAAIRHATTLLMRQPARQRLLLLLSDGKPNDIDMYEGRYGVEDTRQAINEAKMQGVAPFCLTVDRQAASYLPAIFGAHQYALLPKPELLPAVLLEWMKRLVAG